MEKNTTPDSVGLKSSFDFLLIFIALLEHVSVSDKWQLFAISLPYQPLYTLFFFFLVYFSAFLTHMFLPLLPHIRYLLVIFLPHFLNFHGPSNSPIKYLCFMLSLSHWLWGFYHRSWLWIGQFFSFFLQ